LLVGLRLPKTSQNHADKIHLGPENRDVLLKDSLYSAIGLAAASLEQHLDFNKFLETTLVPEVQIQDQGYNLLRRRIAILLGQWVPVKSSELNKDAIYQIFQHLLSKQEPLNDLVVRITAGRQLKHVLDPFEFSPAGFLPYAPSVLQNLMSLVQEVELSETKMGLLDTVRMAVIKMEDNVCVPYQAANSHEYADRYPDCPVLRSDPVVVTPTMGEFRGGASHEAGYSYPTFVIDQLPKAGIRAIP
jgi:hypothetical protein